MEPRDGRCSGSIRGLEWDEAIGDGGAEPPVSEGVRAPRRDRGLVEVVRCKDELGLASSVGAAEDSGSLKSRHDSRCSAINDSRRSCGVAREGGTGTMLALVTARREEWSEP